MKNLKIILFLLFLPTTASITFAQSNPTVEIVLSQPSAQQGDIITADVYVRNALNIAGADIGISVDEGCLRIIDREAGGFLPSITEGSSFSPFSELHDHDTRLAVAITDRTKFSVGDGVFFQTQLQVICEEGIAPLTITFAELSAYEDPSAAEISLISYTMTTNTVTAINAQLAIGPQGSVTAAAVPTSETSLTTVPVATPEIVPEVAPTSETTVPVATSEIAPVIVPVPQSQSLLTILCIVFVLVGIGLPILYVIMRNRRQRDA